MQPPERPRGPTRRVGESHWSGNGVGPSFLGGRILAGLALGERDEWTATGLVDRPPDPFPQCHLSAKSRRLWARGGHFGESQVPDVVAAGPGGIDIERLTGWSAHSLAPPGQAGIGPGPRPPAALRGRQDSYEPDSLGELLGEQVTRAASLTRVR